MQFVTGDETGLLKLVDLRRKVVASPCGFQSRKNAAVAMCWVSPHSSSAAAVVTADGELNVWDLASQSMLHSVTNVGKDVVFLAVRDRQYVTVSSAGAVCIFPVEARDASVASIKFEVGANVQTARLHPTEPILAVGGPEHDLQLWDVSTQELVFQARNAANDELDRRVPVWITGIQFVTTAIAAACAKHASEDERGAAVAATTISASGEGALERQRAFAEREGGVEARELGKAAAAAFVARVRKSAPPEARHAPSAYCCITISAHKYIRVYDTRISPRPLRSITFGDHALTSIDVSTDFHHLIVADTLGMVSRLELGRLASLRVTGGYHGAAGSIKALLVHPTKPYLAAVSMDRFLYVFHLETRAVLGKFYLKQRLRCGLWSAPSGASDEELDPLPYVARQIRMTGMDKVKAPKIMVMGGEGGSGGGVALKRAAASEEADVWEELERRGLKRKGGAAAVADDDDESDDDDDDEDDDDELESEDLGGDEDSDVIAGAEGEGSESDDDDSDDDADSSDSELDGEVDDDDDDDSVLDFEDGASDESDDGEGESSDESAEEAPRGKRRKVEKVGEGGSDNEAEALVDSSKAAKILKKTVSDVKRKESRAMPKRHEAGGSGSGSGRGRGGARGGRGRGGSSRGRGGGRGGKR